MQRILTHLHNHQHLYYTFFESYVNQEHISLQTAAFLAAFLHIFLVLKSSGTNLIISAYFITAPKLVF